MKIKFLNKVMNKIIQLIAILILNHCTNPYIEYYRDYSNGNHRPNQRMIDSGKEPVLLEYSKEPTKDAVKLLEDGYINIGGSSFIDKDASLDEVREAAIESDSELVLYGRTYRNSVSNQIPITTYTTKTTTTRFYGDIYGRMTTKESVPNTQFISYNYDVYEFYATFWKKGKLPLSGFKARELDADERSNIGLNNGILIIAVIKNSFAFYANIVRGDTVTEINGTKLYSYQDYENIISKNVGKEIVLSILRNGQSKKFKIKLLTK
ncbi:PDZ domain-containing protein [Leptospira kmetyi]|uniref:PDZ domain-containing protein n=1 Tax=Leptospira kmetyi TaxID=408139 RepID=A0ABX4N8E4_9LEPT|nr:PDZ domain-containing protein [Leptospira kmetyi]PJZ29631.1 hypothetical protein CH378_11810 [Leptospira kmetyi]